MSAQSAFPFHRLTLKIFTSSISGVSREFVRKVSVSSACGYTRTFNYPKQRLLQLQVLCKHKFCFSCNSLQFEQRRLLQTSQIPRMTMAKTALVIIANGSEEIEAVTPIDTLRRAGVEVTVAGVTGAGNIVMSRNVIVGAEKSLKDALASAPFDAVILPGGLKGAEAFAESAEIGELLKDQEKNGRLIAAICAAPTALHKHGICVGRSVTSYPAMKGIMENNYKYKEDRVVADGNLITSRGPGTSLEFSLALAAYLVGQEKADEVGKAMLVQ